MQHLVYQKHWAGKERFLDHFVFNWGAAPPQPTPPRCFKTIMLPIKQEIFTSSIPTLEPLLHKKCMFLGGLGARTFTWWGTLRLGTAGILCGWALQGYLLVGHFRDTWWLATAGIVCGWALQGYFKNCKALKGYLAVGTLCGWALQGYLAVGHYRDTLRLGTTGIFCGWALQGSLVVRHCRNTLQLGTAGIFGGWTLQGFWAVGYYRDTLRLGTAGIFGGWALRGYSAVVWHCRDTWRLLQGYLVVGHCRDVLRLVVGHCKASLWLGTARIRCHWALQSGSGWGRGHNRL